MTSQPHVSIVTIGLEDKEIEVVRESMAAQTFDDIEVVGSTKEGIPSAWNQALSEASGELYVFTETDAMPIRDDWLERIVADVELPERGVVHYGEVGRPGHGYDLSNLAIPATVMTEFSFDESYPIVEDTELFTRMNKAGVTFEKRYDNPVYHHPAPERQDERAFQRGYHQMRCRLTHGQLGVSSEIRHTPGDLGAGTSISETSSMMHICLIQMTNIFKSLATDIKFISGGGFAALRYWLKV